MYCLSKKCWPISFSNCNYINWIKTSWTDGILWNLVSLLVVCLLYCLYAFPIILTYTDYKCTVCPRSFDPFYMVTKLLNKLGPDFLDIVYMWHTAIVLYSLNTNLQDKTSWTFCTETLHLSFHIYSKWWGDSRSGLPRYTEHLLYVQEVVTHFI